jgi:hypothetical protein
MGFSKRAKTHVEAEFIEDTAGDLAITAGSELILPTRKRLSSIALGRSVYDRVNTPEASNLSCQLFEDLLRNVPTALR